MKILLKLGWAPSLVPDPVLLFYSCTISEIAWFSLGTILLQVPLQLIKGKKGKRKKKGKKGEYSIFSSCLLKTRLGQAETHRVPHKVVWFQCRGFLGRTKLTSMHPCCCPLLPLLAQCAFLYPPCFRNQPFVLVCSLGHVSIHERTSLSQDIGVFCFFSPILLWSICHKPFYIALFCAGHSKGIWFWQSFHEWPEAGPDPAVGCVGL